jgi:hypothetical protein
MIVIALAFAAGSLIGAYDLLSGLEHIRHAAFRPATGA